MGSGASMQSDLTWSDADLSRINATLVSACEPEVLRKVAKTLLEGERGEKAHVPDIKGLLYELANSVHQHRDDIDFQSEEIQALNLMLFDFIDVMDENENKSSNDDIIENILSVMKSDKFVPSVHDEYGNTLLMKSVVLGNIKLLDSCCDFGVDPNQKNFDGVHPLSAVFLQGSKKKNA